MLHISKYQLFCLIVLFEIGSTTLFALGIEAKQDAWTAILVAAFIGLVLMLIYTHIQKYFPEKNFAEIILILLGKFLGSPLVLFYGLFFLYISARNFRDFGELVTMTFLSETPKVAVLILFMLTIVYILFLDLEVLGRTSEMMLPVVLLFIISTYILTIISGNVHLKNLTPILANGMKPVLNAAYPSIVNFPFGEALVFSMYWCYLDSKQAAQKISLLAVGLSAVLLTVTLIIIIAVLGVEYASTATIPLLEVIKAIKIGDILSNLDAIAIVIMFIGGFYKTIIFFYGGVTTLTTLFKIKNNRWIIIPVSIFLVWLSIVFAPNYPYHIWLGLEFSLPYIHNAFQVIIPSLLLMIAWLKKKSNKLN